MTRSNNIFNSHPIRIPVAARESFMESRLPFEVLICRRPEVFPAISHWLIACNGKGRAQAGFGASFAHGPWLHLRANRSLSASRRYFPRASRRRYWSETGRSRCDCRPSLDAGELHLCCSNWCSAHQRAAYRLGHSAPPDDGDRASERRVMLTPLAPYPYPRRRSL